MIELIGILAWLLNVVGNIMLAYKRRSGWPVRLVSIILWGIYAWNIWSLALIGNSITFFGINLWGWWNWRKPKQPEPLPCRRYDPWSVPYDGRGDYVNPSHCMVCGFDKRAHNVR